MGSAAVTSERITGRRRFDPSRNCSYFSVRDGLFERSLPALYRSLTALLTLLQLAPLLDCPVEPPA